MANLACCTNCQRTTRCHALIDDDGSYPMCALCIVVLLADVESIGNTLSLMVTSPSEVTR